MASGAVRFKCWTCEKVYDVRELVGADEPPRLESCCFSTLKEITEAFSGVMLKAVLGRMLGRTSDQARINDKMADLAIVSGDEELKKLALRWRNRKKRNGG